MFGNIDSTVKEMILVCKFCSTVFMTKNFIWRRNICLFQTRDNTVLHAVRGDKTEGHYKD